MFSSIVSAGAGAAWRRGCLLAVGLAGLPAAVQAQVTVLSRQPARNAVSAPRNAAIGVNFSQPITPASAGKMSVQGSLLRGQRPGSVSGGGTAQLTFLPNPAFAPGEVVSVSLPATLTGTSGSALARQVYQFTAATGGTGRGFFIDTTIVAAVTSSRQVLGDLDNDGDLDLVTQGGLFGGRVYLNDGAGRYRFKINVIAAQEAAGMTLADVDRDGDLDLLICDAKNNSVSICLNDGTGTFTDALHSGFQDAPVGARPVSVATGDIDGDGDLDFVTANADEGTSTIYRNGGPNEALGIYYYSPVTVAMGAGPTSVVLADIDNDGDLDLLTANAGTPARPAGEVRVRLNNGLGVFGTSSVLVLPVGMAPVELLAADIDNDGDLDLLTADAGGASISLRLNNGYGGFAGSATLALPPGSTPSGLRAADVDADGDLDLVIAQGKGGRVFTYLNTGGSFALQARALRLSRDPAAPETSSGVTLGDVDGDGDLDLLTANDRGDVVLSLNQSPPPPLPPPTIAALTPAAAPVGATITITGANLTDLVGIRFGGVLAPDFRLGGAGSTVAVTVPAGAVSGPVTIETAEAGTGTSPLPFTVTIPVPVLLTGITPPRNAVSVPVGSAVTAVFSQPITAASAPELRVFSSRRQGRLAGTLAGAGSATLSFSPAQPFAPGEQVSVSLPARLRDAAGNPVGAQVVQFTAATGGTGQLNFATGTSTATGSLSAEATVVGDVDGDGDLDLLTGESGGSVAVKLRLNNGQGTFGAPKSLTSSQGVLTALQLADVDADGDLDLLMASYGKVTVLRNNGQGGFTAYSTFSIRSATQQLLMADLDADGDLDLVVRTTSSAEGWLNDGSGTFSEAPYLSLAFSVAAVTLGDVDGDGDLDLVVAGAINGLYSQPVVEAKLNDGTGQFTAGPRLLLNKTPTQVALADVDANGHLDLLVRYAGSYQTEEGGTLIRLNDGMGTFSGTADLPLPGMGMVVGDADADGDLDLITHSHVALGNGAGSFSAIVPIAGAEPYTRLVAAADLDGDQDLDVVSVGAYLLALRFNQPAPAPTITALMPASGPVGSTVLITGTNFIGVRAVAFNGVAAPVYTVRSATELVATVPAGATSGLVAVSTPAGQATSKVRFEVTLPIAVVAVSPTRNQASAPTNTAISATFDQAISAASAAGLRVHSLGRGLRGGTIAGGGTSQLTFTPAKAFGPGERVSVSLPASLAGNSGSGSVRPQVFQFMAAAAGTGTGLFDTIGTANVPLVYRSNSLTVGDLNNDGNPDFITNDGYVHLNSGGGSFRAGTRVPVSSLYGTTPGLALGDLNNDGKLDIVTNGGSVFLNNGLATFTEQSIFINKTAIIPNLTLGDLDGDGDLDLLLLKSSADSLYIRFNDGTGRFPTYQGIRLDYRPTGVITGDVDNDGDLDVIVACGGLTGPNANSLNICFNNGQGLLTRVVRLPTASGDIQRVVLGDLDNDGDLDLATNNGSVYRNDGQGNFLSSQKIPACWDLALGDVDADGDLDLVLVGSPISSAPFSAVLLNDGQATFSTGVAPASLPAARDGLALTDVDGDGDLDLLVVASDENAAYLRLNQRIARPALTAVTPASGLPGAAVMLTGTDLIGTTEVTFNGTPAPDFTVNSATQITVRVPAGAASGLISVRNPKGSANSPQAFTVLRPVPVLSVSPAPNATAAPGAAVTVTFGQAVPVNSAATLAVFSQRRGGLLAGSRQGAGTSTFTFTPDRPFLAGEQLSVSIPAYTEANQNRVRKQVYQFRAAVGGTGRGYFEAPTKVEADEESLLELGDVTGDGLVDMVILNRPSVEVRPNNGAGGFLAVSTSIAIDTDELRPDFVLGDVDNDGDLDIVVSVSGLKLLVLLNNGAGAFPQRHEVKLTEEPTQLNLADMDADGDLDIIMSNQGHSACTIVLGFNDGTGRFGGLTSTYLSNGTNVLFTNTEIGDVDGDGDLDLLINNNAPYLLLNDGHGKLAAPIDAQFADGESYHIHLVDIDNDGDLDVVSLSSPSTQPRVSSVNISRNNGQGQFTTTRFDVAIGTSSLTVGDLDGDGDLDLLLNSYWGEPAEIRLNNGRGEFLNFRSSDANGTLLCDVDNDGDLDLIGGDRDAPGYNVRLNGPTPPPIISSFAPAAGPVGTTVVVTGSGFQGATEVRFNGTAAPGFVVNSATQITVKVPLGASTGPLSVVSPVATASSATAFTVVAQVVATTLNPGPNAVSVPRNGPLSLSFSAPIASASLADVRVFGSQLRGQRAGSLTGGGTATLRFAPAQAFMPGEQVSVSLPATMQSTDGKPLFPQVYQFRAATGGAGRGLFRGGTTQGVGWFANDLAVGDIDNDGDLDLLLPVEIQYTNNGSVLIERNDGRGRFQPAPGIEYPYGQNPKQLVLGDVNGDGALDVLWSFGYGLSISLNQGNGTFAPTRQVYTSADKLALGDVDADGDLDLIVTTSYLDGRLSVLRNQGDGTFALASAQHLASPAADGVVLADVDNDGDLDALTANGAQGLRLHLNDGRGEFATGQLLTVPGGRVRQALLADLNADGSPDVVAVCTDAALSSSWLSLLRNDGRGGFGPAGLPLAATGYIQRVELADVDADGDLDLVVSYASDASVIVQANDGQGNFRPGAPVAVSRNPGPLVLADFDGDGDVDLAALELATGGAALDIRFNDGQLVTHAATASAADPRLLVYPNPARGQFTLALPPELRPASAGAGWLGLYNSTGQLVLEQPVQLSATGYQRIGVAALPAGIYALRLVLGNRVLIGRITIAN
ncbi:FG-GAP-like repeat-containing protein [Hymenobacter actinosclerus]|uniref:Por secretion system C-terminal sorting domain-containing protein n=1 Tax=Hymenobacter actinosclerus TaxID=82805 RepID=A0A1I0EGX6_9BACT|nr:FG-GAP-like repeat-containing protein [Hymenobacter actinosclerus]SET44320.1 Por secretion system C-terminal sorting domain-containing protein [Hymenobacter actinosclerus]